MYNGIGLQTARGSGTSGHIQKNLSHVGGFIGKTNKVQKLQGEGSYAKVLQEFRANPTPLPRPPNAELLQHEALRKIESKLFEMKKKILKDQPEISKQELEKLI